MKAILYEMRWQRQHGFGRMQSHASSTLTETDGPSVEANSPQTQQTN